MQHRAKNVSTNLRGLSLRSAVTTAVLLGLSLFGMGLSRTASAQPQPDNPMDMTDGFKWQALRLKDEFGVINPKGLINAWNTRQVGLKHSPVPGIAGLPSGLVDDYSIQSPGNVGGVDPTKWTWLGPGNIGGRTRSLLSDPTAPGTYYAGSVGGGVWKSTNSGVSWSPVTGLLSNLAVSTMVMHPTKPKTIYIGTGEGFFNIDAIQGAGIFVTTDGGNSWTQLTSTANTNFSYVNRLAISPDGSILLAATNTGMYRSTNAGTSFTAIAVASTGPELDDVDFHPTDSTKCVCTGNAFNGVSEAFYSTNGGSSWTAATGLPNAGRVETCYALASPTTVYASVDVNGGTIYSSTDGGQSYTAQTVAGSQGYLGQQGWYANAIWAGDPNNANRVIVGGLDLWTSTNGGQNLTKISTWWQAPASAHADHHCIYAPSTYNGTTNNTILFGNDGGIYKADNVWTSPAWTELNNNYGVTQFYGGAGNPTSKVIVGGAQDNGSLRFTGTTTWNTFFGGDGGFCAADPTDPNYFYGEYVFLQIHRSSDGANGSDGYITTGLNDAGSNANFIAPFIIDPNSATRLLGGGASLWVSNNIKANPASAVSWTSIKASTGSLISAIAVNPKKADQIWVGHNNGAVYKTTNGTAANPTWTQVGAGTLPGRYCTRLAVDPTNGNTVFATFGGFTANNVWKSTNGGTTWAAVGNSTLPQSPMNTIAIHPANNQWVYVGSQVGVFASQDGGTTWAATNQGPINVAIDELFLMGTTSTADLVAVTHGRGMYKITPTASSGGGGGGTTPNYVSAALDTTTTPWTVTLTGDTAANAVAVTQQSKYLTVQGAGSTLIGNKTTNSQSVTFTLNGDVKLVCNFAQSATPPTNDTLTLVAVSSSNTTITFGSGADKANLTYCNFAPLPGPAGTLSVDGGTRPPGTANVLTLVGTKTATKVITNIP